MTTDENDFTKKYVIYFSIFESTLKYIFIMASHTLKMFITFIFVAACINFSLYGAYWKYFPARSHGYHINSYECDKIDNNDDSNNTNRDEPKVNISLIKVILINGPKQKLRKKIKVIWTPEYACGDNNTNTNGAVTLQMENNATEKGNSFKRNEVNQVLRQWVWNSSKPVPNRGTNRSLHCPDEPPSLGPLKLKNHVNLVDMAKVITQLDFGGSYTPTDCKPTETVAVIVPCKYQATSRLTFFLYSVHLSLTKQKLAYQIFIVKENNTANAFNPGLLFNIGFIEALKMRSDVTCVVFHDPVLSPTDSNNLYRCSEQPKQLVSFVDSDPNEIKFGGVIAMRPEIFRAVNGFSHHYSDSDAVFEEMYQRLIAANYTIVRSSREYAIYFNNMLINKWSTDPMTAFTVQPPSMVSLVSNRANISKKPADGLTSITNTIVDSKLKLKEYTLIAVDSTRAQKPILWTVTISTKLSNPLYDESTTPSTTKLMISNMSLQLRTRILGI
ncbi:beta-1,4-galactosyltransferase 1-like [Plodia interpunctella]|uniref:beta-1,4-galactosyltransferase 1-like n=1 Tax=Plodia interpunctella TaxID=58824 RepID=UPI002368CD91|nr:beta-1,4-galactosyltransferase 1-like [Plodia interpunctella]